MSPRRRRSLRFGILAIQNVAWADQVERWRHVEALGFDSVWVADHFIDPYRPDAPWFEAWTLLSALATVTREIRIGTLVTSIPLRNPAMLARQALTVDHVSNGRLELGLGAGVPRDPVYNMIGIENWSSRERVTRFLEVVEIVDRCLREEVVSYDGRHYQLEDAIFVPRPVQQPRPPLTIAADGPVMLGVAARYADTWNTYAGGEGESPGELQDRLAQRNEQLDERCREIDRDPAAVRRSLLLVGPDAEACFASAAAFEEAVERYREAGMDELIFSYPTIADHEQILEEVAGEIIPRLRVGDG